MTKEANSRKAFAFLNAENTSQFTEWLRLGGTSGGQFVQPPCSGRERLCGITEPCVASARDSSRQQPLQAQTRRVATRFWWSLPELCSG